MRKGIASPEKNNSPSITLHVKTRTPLEAFQMLRQGQPIDVMAGYYEEHLSDDFWMMDKTEKLRTLAYLKADSAQRYSDIESQLAEIEANQIKQKNDEAKAAKEASDKASKGDDK